MVGEKDLQSVNECPDCASQNIVHGMMRDQIICRDCGLIFEPLAPAAAKPARVAAKKGKAKKAKPKKAKKTKKRAKPGKKKRRR